MIETTSSGISITCEIYTSYAGAVGILLHIYGMFTKGKLFLFCRKVLFSMCVSQIDCSLCFSNSTVHHPHANIPWHPSALLQQNIRIAITFLENKY
jgi:hypothetical protein